MCAGLFSRSLPCPLPLCGRGWRQRSGVFRSSTLSTFSASANPTLLKLFLAGGARRRSPPPTLLRSVSSPFVAYSAPLMAPQKVAAEYAKSNRSSCKACGQKIPAGSLRLGLSSTDPRGFEVNRWHHLDCFPVKAQPFAAVEKIQGYYLLKRSDREVLKNLEAAAAKSSTDEGHVAEKDESKKRDLILQGHSAGKDESKNTKQSDFKKMKAGEAEAKEDDETIMKKPRVLNTLVNSYGDGKGGEEIVFSISDAKTKYKDASLPPNWKAIQTVIFREADDGLRDSDKIAAFDFDGCLVNTSVKRIGPDAWSLFHPSIPEKLQNLYNDGYKLVIFTNESNIERWKNKRQLAVDSKIGRLENFLKDVKVPMQVFIACGLGKGKDRTDDPFRKPNPGMWRILEKHFNSGIAIDMDRSFFVGDAAGRSNDHSDADAKFAMTVGLKFHLPEDFFGA